MTAETKRLSLKLDDGAEDGSFTATFSTFDVMDHHGDVVRPGAFQQDAVVPIGAYEHEMWDLPVGRGMIKSDEERAWVDGNFLLDTQMGGDTYRTVKALQDVLEWSYIFTVTKSSEGEWDAGDGVDREVRFIEGVDVWSVDPVLRGASIGTGTDAIKSRRDGPFGVHAEKTLQRVTAFTERLEARLELRARDDRHLGADDLERVTALLTGLDDLRKRLDEALREQSDENPIDLARELAAWEHTLSRESVLA